MNSSDILQFRLSNQGLINSKFQKAEEVVKHLGAVQAQDYSGAIWALGQRLSRNLTEDDIEKDLNSGKILRTHVMRPTWHFVHPEDIRLLLMLTGERVSRAMSSYNKLLDLNAEVFTKAQKVIGIVLKGGNYMTRQELKTELTSRGIVTNTQRLAHIVMQAELDALIVSGPRNGKQFTYALIEERVPKQKPFTRDEALNELTRRYFLSHGPATIKDFVWWSGLTVADAKKGIERSEGLRSETVDKVEYWLFDSKMELVPDDAFLLPNYDEYGIAYKERSAFFNPEYVRLLDSRGNATFQHLIVIRGQFVGTWKRKFVKDSVVIDYKFFAEPSKKDLRAFKQSTDFYGKFLKKKIVLKS